MKRCLVLLIIGKIKITTRYRYIVLPDWLKSSPYQPHHYIYIYTTGEDAKEMENGIAHLINNLALRYTVTYILTI